MNGLLDLMSAASPQTYSIADSSQSLGPAEFSQQVQRLAQLLQARGCRRLGLHADNSVAWVIADLACQQANIVCVPLPLFFSWPQTLHALHTCGIDAILTPDPQRFADHFKLLAQTPVCGELSLLIQPHIHVPQLPPETGKVTFTSGSTGAPKGVCLSTAQQSQQAAALMQAVGIARPVHLCLLPLATLLENIAGVYAPLLAGGTVVLRSMTELGFNGSRLVAPQKFLQAILDVKPDTIILIPQLLQLLVSAVTQGYRLPPLKFIAVGGAHVSAGLLAEARRRGLPVYEGYGLTECASVVSLNTPRADRIGSCGTPLPGLQIEVDNGEIVVQGNAMLGYAGEPGSWHPARIATGDLGRLDEAAFLHIEGRRKNLLISSYGRNISPEWVESELLASLALREAVVFGDGRPHCIALVTPANTELDDSAIAAAISSANKQLPDYAQVRQWLRLPHPLAATAGLLTANARPIRSAIFRRYQKDIDALYGEFPAQDETNHDYDEATQ